MCPACIATATLITTGTTSAGAFTAYVVRKLRTKIGANSASPMKIIRRIDHEQEPNKTSEGRFTS